MLLAFQVTDTYNNVVQFDFLPSSLESLLQSLNMEYCGSGRIIPIKLHVHYDIKSEVQLQKCGKQCKFIYNKHYTPSHSWTSSLSPRNTGYFSNLHTTLEYTCPKL